MNQGMFEIQTYSLGFRLLYDWHNMFLLRLKLANAWLTQGTETKYTCLDPPLRDPYSVDMGCSWVSGYLDTKVFLSFFLMCSLNWEPRTIAFYHPSEFQFCQV